MARELFTSYVFIFFIYSFFGWLIEVCLKFIDFHRFVNRGFLVGPYCPVYGLGAVLIVTFTNGFSKKDHSRALIFLISLLLCGLVEYLVSYFLEKRYKARWWDYSTKPMNLNGRIWIGNLILFGLGGLFIVELMNPLIMPIFYRMNIKYRMIFAIVALVLMLLDYIVSYFVMKLIRVNIKQSKADNTEDIKNEMKLLVKDKNILYSRFINAYPEVKFRTDKIMARLKEIENETKRIREEVEKALDEERELIKNDMIPASLIKNEIIESQEKLIGLLEDENSSKDEILILKEEIENKKDILDKRRNILKLAKKIK
jgi:uncharacterized membrane protein